MTCRRGVSVELLLLVILFAATEAKGGQPETPSAATLQGEEAVQHLKEQGQYDSLVEAVKAARVPRNEAGGDATPDVVAQSAKLMATDSAAGDSFGASVAISGDTAIVGAYWDNIGANTTQGSAYVFGRSGTTWTQQQRLTADDGAPNDHFGRVAIIGETIVVGAPYDDVAVIRCSPSHRYFPQRRYFHERGRHFRNGRCQQQQRQRDSGGDGQPHEPQ